MKVTATYGVERTWRTMALALIAAGMMVVMLVAQLFTYEDLAIALSGIVSTNDAPLLTVGAGVLVLAELFTLPYLLGMYISRLMRYVSAALAFLVAGFWLVSALTNAHAPNSGLFSTALSLPGGIWAALWSLVLFVCICLVIFSDSRIRHARVAPLR